MNKCLRNEGEILAFCNNCGCPQGTFANEQEMQEKVAEQNKCPKCGCDFSFQSDGQIWGLNWKPLVPPIQDSEEKFYEKGELYKFYRDILELVSHAKNEVIITDNWADEELINLYLDKVPRQVKIKVLTKRPQGQFLVVGKKFKAQPNVNFEARTTAEWHDRWIFVDNECWVTGQSVKDAGTKPTYLIKLGGYGILKKAFDEAWNQASPIV